MHTQHTVRSEETEAEGWEEAEAAALNNNNYVSGKKKDWRAADLKHTELSVFEEGGGMCQLLKHLFRHKVFYTITTFYFSLSSKNWFLLKKKKYSQHLYKIENHHERLYAALSCWVSVQFHNNISVFPGIQKKWRVCFVKLRCVEPACNNCVLRKPWCCPWCWSHKSTNITCLPFYSGRKHRHRQSEFTIKRVFILKNEKK